MLQGMTKKEKKKPTNIKKKKIVGAPLALGTMPTLTLAYVKPLEKLSNLRARK